MKLLNSAPAAFLLLVLAGSLFAQMKSASPAVVLQPPGPDTCQWKETAPTEVRSPIQMDIHAGYRTFAFKSDGTVGLRIRGDFPHAAFMSFTVYDNGFVYSVLTDYQIAPDSGSVNPFKSGELVRAPLRAFTVSIFPAGVDPGLPNALYMPPVPRGSTVKTIAIEQRVYLPEPYQNRYGGDCPTIEAFDPNNPGTPVALPPRDDTVNTDESANFAGGTFQSPLPHDGIIQFYRPPASVVPFADASAPQTTHDCTSYLMSTVFPDQLAVIHIPKIPGFFNNTAVDDTTRFPDPPDQVRYLSFGSYGASLLQAAQNENIAGPELKTLPDGSATFVAIPISLSDADRQMVENKADQLGYNHMPLAEYGPLIAGYEPGPHINPFLIYRNKVPLPGFAGDIKNVACFHGPKFNGAPAPPYAASPKNMGDYAPIGVECSVPDFLDGICGQVFPYPHP